MVYIKPKKPCYSRTDGERGFVFCAQGKRKLLDFCM